jgi:hypothetical protein
VAAANPKREMIKQILVLLLSRRGRSLFQAPTRLNTRRDTCVIPRSSSKSKFQMTNDRQISSINPSMHKRIYDLKERAFEFAKQVRLFVKTIPRGAANEEDATVLLHAIHGAR